MAMLYEKNFVTNFLTHFSSVFAINFFLSIVFRCFLIILITTVMPKFLKILSDYLYLLPMKNLLWWDWFILFGEQVLIDYFSSYEFNFTIHQIVLVKTLCYRMYKSFNLVVSMSEFIFFKITEKLTEHC